MITPPSGSQAGGAARRWRIPDRPRRPDSRNWLCFARMPRCRRCFRPWPGVAFSGRCGANWVRSGQWAPGDGSTNAFSGPCRSLSVSANWLRLYNRAQRRLRRRPRPPASAPVDGGNWLRFARLRSEYRVYADRTGLSRLKAVLRTVHDCLGDRCSSGVNLRRWRMLGHSRQNLPKSWSLICRFAILLLDYHTGVSIPRQVKSWCRSWSPACLQRQDHEGRCFIRSTWFPGHRAMIIGQ